MKKIIPANPVYKAGLIALVLSLALFQFVSVDQSDQLGLFFMHLAIAYIYLIACLRNRYLCKRDDGLVSANPANFSIFGLLFMIAAFSLNQEIVVFHTLVPWLRYSLLLVSFNLLLLAYRNYFPKWIQQIQYLIMGYGILVFLYFALFTVPILPFSLLFFWFFGLPLVALAPIVLLVCSLHYAFKVINENRTFRWVINAGWLIPMGLLVFFIYKIDQGQRQISYALNDAQIKNEKMFPDWVQVAQKVPPNFFTNSVLKYNLTFTTDFWEDFGFNPGSRMNINGIQYHDPTIILASQFARELSLSKEERVKILETNMDIRHYTEERLWRGNDLETSNVITHVRLYPEYRISYTEKTLTIANTREHGRSQEAIYTFHLPEGTAVSSLSLWIEGKEEKGYLTTKGKADSAYKTIVGVENRDPSLVTWREGNQVSVRVFPCNPDNPRKVKVGFTSPLVFTDKRLVYQNIYFEGPKANGAAESIYLYKSKHLNDLESPFSFSNFDQFNQVHRSNYKANWHMTFEACPLSTKRFSVKGKSYGVQKLVENKDEVNFKNFYLDIDKTWSKDEFNQIWEVTKNARVSVFMNDRLSELTAENREEYFEILNQYNFSLFPIHLIKEPSSSLIISKGTQQSPLLSELKKSSFKMELSSLLSERPEPTYFYHIGKELSPFQKSMLELGLFHYSKGNIVELSENISSKTFTTHSTDSNVMAIPSAQIQLVSQQDTIASKDAPDHLLRLFTYNSLMKQLGGDYFNPKLVREDIIAMAKYANVVSPVSSLIVLETKKDYERFDIKKGEDTLGNANINDSGSVPEPHEWLLIILGGLIISFTYFKRHFA